MTGFTIEDSLDSIKSPMTKKYLEEVISCYNNGNYRATTVTLYTTMIYDLLHKLTVLQDIYKDEKAMEILEDTQNRRKENPTSPAWERDLIDDIYNKLGIFNDIEYKRILQFKDERNYSAHPIYDESSLKYELISPTREKTMSLIKEIFESVFLKDAIISKHLTMSIIKDSNNYFERLKKDGLRSFLKNKYYDNMPMLVKERLFATLWKFVFILDNEDCNKNRESNYWTLAYLYDCDPEYYIRIIEKDASFSSFNIPDVNLSNMPYRHMMKTWEGLLIKFLSTNNRAYKSINDFGKNIIKQIVDKTVELKVVSMFCIEDSEKHFQNIIKHMDDLGFYFIEDEAIDLLYLQSENRHALVYFYDFIIKCYIRSNSFDSTRSRFVQIEKYITYFHQEQIEMILEGMNYNNQIYNNTSLHLFLEVVSEQYEKVFFKEIEFFLYPNLFEEDIKKFKLENKAIDIFNKIEEGLRLDNKYMSDKTVKWWIDEYGMEFNNLSKEDYPNLTDIY